MNTIRAIGILAAIAAFPAVASGSLPTGSANTAVEGVTGEYAAAAPVLIESATATSRDSGKSLERPIFTQPKPYASDTRMPLEGFASPAAATTLKTATQPEGAFVSQEEHSGVSSAPNAAHLGPTKAGASSIITLPVGVIASDFRMKHKGLQGSRPENGLIEGDATNPADRLEESALPFEGAAPGRETVPPADRQARAVTDEKPKSKKNQIGPKRPSAQPNIPETAEFSTQQQQSFDLRPGTTTFPVDESEPVFTLNDELILQFKVRGIDATDTIIVYGTREGLYLPVGELTRILDLAVRVSDDGHYANGWFLTENRTVTLDLRNNRLTTNGGSRPLLPDEVQAFEGEMYLRSDLFAEILPVKLEPNLRTQSVLLTTLEPFPFEERLRRESERARLKARQGQGEEMQWPRQETPWLAASLPLADVELRAVSDSTMDERLEGDFRFGGDLAFMTAQAFLSATTRDGLVASLVQLGRRDGDGDLLGPLKASEFQVGDVATVSMPVGLRGRAGRGGFVSNRPFQAASVFEQIDLRGVLPDGYEVELYRNDILIGSVASAVNRQYEFLDVPVDYGLNIFRLVFFGPQGQRREEVRRVSVGDGRVAAGDLQYDFGAIQRGVNLLGVEGPDFNPLEGFGSWQAGGSASYGLNADVTAIAGFSYFEDVGEDVFLGTTGLRTGLGGLAVRADAAVASDGSNALGAGLGGRAFGGAFSLSHFEYGSGFSDEIRSNTRDPLRRATELDFNANLALGGIFGDSSIPVAARLRHVEFLDGRSSTDAIFRSSARLPGMIVSNTFEYTRNTAANGSGFSQLIGNFDLATFARSRTQLRGSVGYSLLQGPEITNVSGEIDYQIDGRTVVSGQASYSFSSAGLRLGASAIKEFDKFSLAFDGSYVFEQRSYSMALRLGFSFGRDPIRRNFFLAPPGQASSGSVSLRAFQDLDGDSVFGPGDVPLQDVNFSVFNNTSETDERGTARLTRLGNGVPVSVQVDPSSLPDILLAPVSRGIEIVPRPGRFHVMDFPIVALSEVEGTVSFSDKDTSRGVSGLRLQLIDRGGEVVATARTERGGYYFFEQVMPGRFQLIIEPEQAERLGICLTNEVEMVVEPSGDIYNLDLEVQNCALEIAVRSGPSTKTVP
ncbi:hypothetical protein [Erythrobacter rubeus]|uniref:Carboxypeptidase regulatory-like domain-containing protein n=1 Tax=Erythrobacter rubeus TaxID=2760803 RepID=A0ABR8KQU4_9SPHN|nr:hypothetical protein [Erythrobacter rubeus]MBD2843114.1 hypothetical protein [Erythrobacter rubeus]